LTFGRELRVTARELLPLVAWIASCDAWIDLTTRERLHPVGEAVGKAAWWGWLYI